MNSKIRIFAAIFTAIFCLICSQAFATEATLVNPELHDAIIGQWNVWDLNLLDSSRYKFEKFTLALPPMLSVNEEFSDESNLHIEGALYGFNDGDTATITIYATDRQTGEEFTQDLGVLVRYFSPDESANLTFWVDCNFDDLAYFENGELVYNLDNYEAPGLSIAFLSEYNGGVDYSASPLRKYKSRFRNSIPRDRANDGIDYYRIPGAVTIEAADQPYHYTTNDGDAEVSAGAEKHFDLGWSNEYSRYFLAEDDTNGIGLTSDAYEALKDKKISWQLPGVLENFSGETTLGEIYPYEQNYVPKVTLIFDSDGKISGLDWHIAKRDDPDTPISANFPDNIDGTNFEVRTEVYDRDKNTYDTISKHFEFNNDAIESTIQFDNPVDLRDLQAVQVAMFQYYTDTGHNMNPHWYIPNRNFEVEPHFNEDFQPWDAHAGEWYDMWLECEGTNLEWSFNGNLPEGLVFDNGRIFGEAQELGTFTFTVTITNSLDSDTREFTLTVPEPTGVSPAILSNTHGLLINGKSDLANIWVGDLNISLFKDYSENDNASKLDKASSTSTSTKISPLQRLSFKQRIDFLRKLNSRKKSKSQSQTQVTKTKSAPAKDKAQWLRRAGTLTIPKTSKTYSYHDDNETYTVSKNEQKTFELADFGSFYNPATFYSDYYFQFIAFVRDSFKDFSSRKISWNFSDSNLQDGSKQFKNTLTFDAELKKPIPYVEYIKDGDYVTGFKLRFVNKSNPNTPVKLGNESYVDIYFDWTWDDDENNDYNPTNNLHVSADEIAEKIVYINQPIKADRIRIVSVYFNRNTGDDYSDDYQWNFQNPVPFIFEDQYFGNAHLGEDYWWNVNYEWLPDFVTTTWSLSGNVPPGLSINEYGAINGRPTEPGKYTFTVTASNNYGSSSREVTISVIPPSSVYLKSYSLIDSYFKNGKATYNESEYNLGANFLLVKDYNEDYYENDTSVARDSAKKSSRKLTKAQRKSQGEFFNKLHAQLSRKKSRDITVAIRDKSDASFTERIDDAFTVGAGSGAYYYDNFDGRTLVESNEAVTFSLLDESWAYCPVIFRDDNSDENVRNYFTAAEGYDLEDVFNGRSLTWDFSNADLPDELNGSETLNNFSKFAPDDVVPYLEFDTDKSGNVNSVRVRLVNKSDTNTAITVDDYTWLGVGFALYDDDDVWFENGDGINFNPGDTAEGEFYFNKPVPLKNICHLRVDDCRNDDEDYMYYFNNPIPKIRGYLPEKIYSNEYLEQVIWLDGGIVDGSTNWSVSKGKLPTGMKLDVNSENGWAAIIGTPTKNGKYTFTLKLDNKYGSTEEEFTITVSTRPDPDRAKVVTTHGLFAFWNPDNGTPMFGNLHDGIEFNGLNFELNKIYDENDYAKAIDKASSESSEKISRDNLASLAKYRFNRAAWMNAQKKNKLSPDSKLAKATAKVPSLVHAPKTTASSTAKMINKGFTIEANGGAYSYWTYGYREVPANTSQTFAVYDDNAFCAQPVEFASSKSDEDYRHLWFYGFDGKDEFYNNIGNDTDSFRNRRISWSLGKKGGSGSETLSYLTGTQDVINEFVPYFELIENDDGEIYKINWHLGKLGNENDAIALDYGTWVSLYIDPYDEDGGEYNPTDKYQFFNAGNTFEGTFYLNKTIKIDDLRSINIFIRRSDELTYFWNIANATPRIVDTNLPDATAGLNYEAWVEISGAGFTDAWIVKDDLPKNFEAELVSADDGNLILICNPPIDAETNTYKITIHVENGYGEDEQECTLNVKQAEDLKPKISTSEIDNAKVGEEYYQKFDLETYTNVTWTISGLPKGKSIEYYGLNFDSRTGVLSGEPTKVFKGNLTVKATNAIKGSATKTFRNFRIEGDAPEIILDDDFELDDKGIGSITLLTNVEVEEPFTVKLSGAPGTTFKCTGKAPSGMLISPYSSNDDGDDDEDLGEDRRFVISGTPSKKGTYTLKFSVTNPLGDKDDKTVKFIVNESLQITTTQEKIKDATFGSKYNLKFAYKGGNSKTITWDIDGDLPEGLTFDEEKGTLTGTPKETGDFDFTITLTDSSLEEKYPDNSSVSEEFTLHVKGIVPVMKLGTFKAKYQEYYEYKLQVSKGSTPLTWEIIDGELPEGLDELEQDGDDWVIKGTPQQDFKGSITLQVSNEESENQNKTVTKKLNITVVGTKPKFDTSCVKEFEGYYNGKVYVSNNETFSFIPNFSGSPNIKFKWNGKAPADWIEVDEESGEIFGTAENLTNKDKSFNVKIKAENYTGNATLSFTLVVRKADDDSAKKPDTNSDAKSEAESESETKLESESESEAKSESESESEASSESPEVFFTGNPSSETVGNIISVNGNDYMIIATLPELEVSQSAQYDFRITLDENAPIGAKLFYFANASSSEENPNDDDEIIDFADESGQEISEVPDNRSIIASPWLNPNTSYKPVIAVKCE